VFDATCLCRHIHHTFVVVVVGSHYGVITIIRSTNTENGVAEEYKLTGIHVENPLFMSPRTITQDMEIMCINFSNNILSG
jgi:hypothetical protein